jgi:hypothetical protein
LPQQARHKNHVWAWEEICPKVVDEGL